MTATLEERVAALERQLAEMQAQPWFSASAVKEPLSIYGIAKDDPLFDEAVRLGEEWRASQTHEQEIQPPLKKKGWQATVGWANNSKLYDAATKAGEEYRRSQTYEKEIEDRGGVGY